MDVFKKIMSVVANFGIGRYRLPNLFSKLGHCCISFSAYLNIFQRKLKAGTWSTARYLRFCVVTVPTGCKLLEQKITFLDMNQTVVLKKPCLIHSSIEDIEAYACTAKLPDTYMAELNNAVMFEGTELVLLKNKYVIYDEIENAFLKPYPYGIKSPLVKKIFKGQIELRSFSSEIFIKEAIHFTKDHSFNYYHWLIECLPRLLLVNQMLLPPHIPLLVDGCLPKQYYEALALFNNENRKIIKIKKRQVYLVEKLHFPSQLSVLHDNYNSLVQYDKDFVISPKALTYVREICHKACNIVSPKGFRRLFVVRVSAVRKLLNFQAICDLLLKYKFELVFPEKLSFASQVKLFSDAAVIVGQTGAGLANILFAPLDCKIIILSAKARNLNLHIFNAIANGLEMEKIGFLLGEPSRRQRHLPIHSDFTIDVAALEKYIIDYCHEQ